MTTITGNRQTFSTLKKLSTQYNLADKKLAEFSELDKIVYQNIKKFAKMI